MFGEKKENRFISIICERGKYNERMMVYVDTETGIQYLHVGGDNEGGMTALLNEDGKPLINEEYRRKKDWNN